MRAKRILSNVVILVIAFGMAGVACAAPMSTAFTYQGRLIDSNSVADGLYDFQFSLHDANTAGSQLGEDVNEPDVDVIDGYFTVELDFGGGVFDGNAVWLQTGVRPGVENDPCSYEVLLPRQEVTPTPYALQAKSVSVPLTLTAEAPNLTAVVGVSSTGDGVAIFGQGKNGDFGILGLPDIGVYGEGTSGLAGKFDGNVNVTGDLAVGGTVNATTLTGDGSGLTNLPATAETDPTVAASVKDGVDWLEVTSRPAGLDDGDDVGITVETDPKIGVNTTNYLPRWNGSVLETGSIFDDGNIGIGTSSPLSKLSVGGIGIADVGVYGQDSDYGVYGYGSSGTGVYGVGSYAGVFGIDANSGSWGQLGYDAYGGYFVGNGYFSGDVGIGTAIPGDKLDVVGHINSTETYKLDSQTVLANTGTDNIFVGEGAGASITTGWGNSAMGYQALYDTNEGYQNSAMGNGALLSNTTGYDNSAVGYRALYSNTTGHENSAVGANSLSSNTTGNYNSAMGYQALSTNTTGGNNSAVGYQSLYSNTTGTNNSAMGYQALYSNAIGSSNSAVGKSALGSNTTGNSNSAMGAFALGDNTEGNSNSAMGYAALGDNTTGNANSAMGYQALSTNTTGNYNSAVGCQANALNQEGSKNTTIGYQAGRGASFHNKSGNVFLGYQAGYNETGDNKLYIDNSSISTPLIYGDFYTNVLRFNGDVGIGRNPTTNDLEVAGTASKTAAGNWLANSDARIKADIQTVTNALETLDKVRLVSFKYTEDYKAKHPSIDKRRYLNVIAQEFRQVFPEYVKSSGEKLTNGEDILQVDAYPLTVYSAAAVQQLHGMVKTIVKEKDAEIAALKEENENIKNRLSTLENAMRSGSLIGKEL